MIVMITQWYPLNKTNEMAEKYLEVIKTGLPSYIKKWHTFTTSEGDHMKVYNLIMAERGKGDEAQIHIAKTLQPFSTVEGYKMRSEVVMGARDSFEALGRKL